MARVYIKEEMILSQNKAAVPIRTALNYDASQLVEAFFLSLENIGGHYRINYEVIKDFTANIGFECLETYAACKSFLGVITQWQHTKKSNSK